MLRDLPNVHADGGGDLFEIRLVVCGHRNAASGTGSEQPNQAKFEAPAYVMLLPDPVHLVVQVEKQWLGRAFLGLNRKSARNELSEAMPRPLGPRMATSPGPLESARSSRRDQARHRAGAGEMAVAECRIRKNLAKYYDQKSAPAGL
jgi:hypothetical protein